MKRFLLPVPGRPPLSPGQFNVARVLYPFIRHNSSLTPRKDSDSAAKKSSGIFFSEYGDSEPNNPMFEQLALLTPAIIPEDPEGIIRTGDSAAKLLDNSALVVERRLEMMTVFLGFEQCNRYIIMNPKGEHQRRQEILELKLSDSSFTLIALSKPMFSTKKATKSSTYLLTDLTLIQFERPIRVLNSRIRIHNMENEGRILGEVRQVWAPLRRKYELSVLRRDTFRQFAAINEPMLSWDFTLADIHGNLIGSINRNFRGFGREIFTDTGQYVLRMDAASPDTTNIDNSASVYKVPDRKVEQLLVAPEVKDGRVEWHVTTLANDGKSIKLPLTVEQQENFESKLATGRPFMEVVEKPNAKGLTLDERAVMLATAVSVDFDYFSHQSGQSTGIWPIWMYPSGSSDPGTNPTSSNPEAGGSGAQTDDDIVRGGGADTEGGSEWGQEGPPSEENPWIPDDPNPKDDGWGGQGNDSEGDTGGDGDGEGGGVIGGIVRGIFGDW